MGSERWRDAVWSVFRSGKRMLLVVPGVDLVGAKNI